MKVLLREMSVSSLIGEIEDKAYKCGIFYAEKVHKFIWKLKLRCSIRELNTSSLSYDKVVLLQKRLFSNKFTCYIRQVKHSP